MSTNNHPREDIFMVKTKFLYELFLREGKLATDLAGLYDFYYYTSKWQRNDTPKATNSYVAKKLGWSTRSVSRKKAILIKMGLIRNVVRKNKEGKIVGHYVLVNYFATESSYLAYLKTTSPKSSGVDKKTTSPKNDSVVFCPTNTKRSNNKDTKRNNRKKKRDIKRTRTKSPLVRVIRKRTKTPKTEFYNWCASIIKGASLKKSKRIVTKTQTTKWAKAIEVFVERKLSVSKENTFQEKKEYIEGLLIWYRKNTGQEFVPEIFSASSFIKKFHQLESAVKRDSIETQRKPAKERPKNAYYGKESKQFVKQAEKKKSNLKF
jgi:hypothetical protein